MASRVGAASYTQHNNVTIIINNWIAKMYDLRYFESGVIVGGF